MHILLMILRPKGFHSAAGCTAVGQTCGENAGKQMHWPQILFLFNLDGFIVLFSFFFF